MESSGEWRHDRASMENQMVLVAFHHGSCESVSIPFLFSFVRLGHTASTKKMIAATLFA